MPFDFLGVKLLEAKLGPLATQEQGSNEVEVGGVGWVCLSGILFFFFSELGTEPRALRLLGKCSTTELNPQPPLWDS